MEYEIKPHIPPTDFEELKEEYGEDYNDHEIEEMVKNNEVHFIDTRLVPYLNLFFKHSWRHNVEHGNWTIEAVIVRGLNKRGKAGECEIVGNVRKIRIDLDWFEAHPDEALPVILRECGHCFLNRDHYNEESNGVMVSIMNEEITDQALYFFKNSDYYLKELFTKK